MEGYFPLTVGLTELWHSVTVSNFKKRSNYPPYNIRKVNDEQYTIELAVAGFEEVAWYRSCWRKLLLQGLKTKMPVKALFIRLAARNFVKKFVLSDDMV